jgi:hypothetical protein
MFFTCTPDGLTQVIVCVIIQNFILKRFLIAGAVNDVNAGKPFTTEKSNIFRKNILNSA